MNFDSSSLEFVSDVIKNLAVAKKILIESERKNKVGRKLEKKVGEFCYTITLFIFLHKNKFVFNSGDL